MPRPNAARTLGSESALSRRVQWEREIRGWSFEGLAERMTQAGCAIHGSAIYKIEKAGRRITVDELVAFSRVFKLELDDIIEPPEVLVDEEVRRVERAEDEAFTELEAAVKAAVAARMDRWALRARASSNGQLQAALDRLDLERWGRLREIAEANAQARRKGRGSAEDMVRIADAIEQHVDAKFDSVERQGNARITSALNELEEAIMSVADERSAARG